MNQNKKPRNNPLGTRADILQSAVVIAWIWIPVMLFTSGSAVSSDQRWIRLAILAVLTLSTGIMVTRRIKAARHSRKLDGHAKKRKRREGEERGPPKT